MSERTYLDNWLYALDMKRRFFGLEPNWMVRRRLVKYVTLTWSKK